MTNNDIKLKIKELVDSKKLGLDTKIIDRVNEMEDDNRDHHMIYGVLGINEKERNRIDVYQNKGRLVYKALGELMEECAMVCFKHAFPEAKKVRIPNTISPKPKTFEIDCLINDREAIEVKWRDATTDGDHVTKEHNRVRVIKEAGYNPVRLTFFEPNRDQAKIIQKRIKTLYNSDEIQGEFYEGQDTWNYIKKMTKIDLKKILEDLEEK